MNHAIEHLIPQHLERIREPRNQRLNKTERAVQERLREAINYHDGRAAHFRAQEAAGKVNAHLNRVQEEQKADDLQERLESAPGANCGQERLISATRPIVRGGALIIPIGALQDDNH